MKLIRLVIIVISQEVVTVIVTSLTALPIIKVAIIAIAVIELALVASLMQNYNFIYNYLSF